jgi:uncharacterized protein
MLEKLYLVQSKDLEIDALETEKTLTPKDLLDTQIEHSKLRQQLAEQQQRYDGVRKQVNANELELESLTARRKAASQSALHASSAKEASQYQNQELQFATRLQELEEDTLPLIETLENYGNRLKLLQEQMAQLEPKLNDLTVQEQARVQDVNERIRLVQLERDQLAQEVSAALLKQYDHVRRARRGVALAAIVGGQRCGGCNVQLPLHVIQKAKKLQDVTRCPSCGRILWAKEG